MKSKETRDTNYNEHHLHDHLSFVRKEEIYLLFHDMKLLVSPAVTEVVMEPTGTAFSWQGAFDAQTITQIWWVCKINRQSVEVKTCVSNGNETDFHFNNKRRRLRKGGKSGEGDTFGSAVEDFKRGLHQNKCCHIWAENMKWAKMDPYVGGGMNAGLTATVQVIVWYMTQVPRMVKS